MAARTAASDVVLTAAAPRPVEAVAAGAGAAGVRAAGEGRVAAAVDAAVERAAAAGRTAGAADERTAAVAAGLDFSGALALLTDFSTDFASGFLVMTVVFVVMLSGWSADAATAGSGLDA